MSQNDLPHLASLKNKRIVLGVTGGIAAYKALELLRLLIKQGAIVHVAMTPAACEFIQPLSFQALSGHAVHVSQWPEGAGDTSMAHIDLSRQADCMLIAPCTANAMASYAHGLGGNLLDNLVLARKCPIAIAPAMNVEMWNNPATQRNVKQLQADGFHIFGPNSGIQACGEIGEGRLLEPSEIVFEMAKLFCPQILQDKKILLTAGPTYEAIDPVRGITNKSSGKMGYAMAQACYLLGAEVTLISGPTALSKPYGIRIEYIESAQQMHDTVFEYIHSNHVFVGVAAVADYGIQHASANKQKKDDTAKQKIGLEIDFKINPDILALAGQLKNKQNLFVIGFAAETQHLDEYSKNKLIKKNADVIIGNLAQNALGANSTSLTIYRHTAQPVQLESMPKLDAALHALQLIFQKK